MSGLVRLSLLLLFGCVQPAPRVKTPAELEPSTPEAQGMASAPLLMLTRFIHDHPNYPVFSLLISRNGKLVYQLYTSSLGQDEAHYQMSATKSVLSALVGIAIDRRMLKEASVAESLPRSWFTDDEQAARFTKVTLRQVLGMAALDAPDPPRDRTPAALARYERFWSAPNRAAFVLHDPILQTPFQYNDATPALAAGALQYATGGSALAFAEETLFGPMGFRNYEWMHQDASGMDNGGYGLRLRPIDMQKFGLLFLAHGMWNGRQLISREWVERSFTPWNRSTPERAEPDYGWYWWTEYYAAGWTTHLAKGWKGQRIAVVPEQNLVVTMTGCVEDGSENEFFNAVMTKAVMPSVQGGAGAPSRELGDLLEETRRGAPRWGDFVEYRMVPSVAHKQARRPFTAIDRGKSR